MRTKMEVFSDYIEIQMGPEDPRSEEDSLGLSRRNLRPVHESSVFRSSTGSMSNRRLTPLI